MTMETNQYGLWAAKQTAKGSVPAIGAFTHRFNQVGGAISGTRDEGSENFSDLTEFSTSVDYVNSVTGGGSPVVQATPEELAWLLYIFHGAETTTAVTGPPAKTKHTFVPAGVPGFYSAWFQRVGASQILRQLHADCRMPSLVIEGATGQKIVRATPELTSFDPAINQTADPTQALPAAKPFLFTDGAARFTIDGVVFRGHSRFQLTLNRGLTPIQGDDVTFVDVVAGLAAVGLEVTCYFDADGIAWFNQKYYGSASPAQGARPLKTVGTLGSYAFDLQSRDDAGVLNGNAATLAVPGVKWNLPASPGPAPDGGAAELTLTGQMRRVGSQQPYTLAVTCDAPAFT